MWVELRRKYGRDRGHAPMSEEDVLRIKPKERPGVVFVTPNGRVHADLEHVRMVEDTVTLHSDPTKPPGPDNPSVIVPEHVLAALYVSGYAGAIVEIRGDPGHAKHVWRADCYLMEAVEELGGPADPPEIGEPAAKRTFIREGEAPSTVRNVEGRIEPAEGFEVRVEGEVVSIHDLITVRRGNVSNKTPEHAGLDVVADVAMLAGTTGAKVEISRPTEVTSVHPTDLYLATAAKRGIRVCSLNVGRMRGAVNLEKGVTVRVGTDLRCEVCITEEPVTSEIKIGDVTLVREGGKFRTVEPGAVRLGDEVVEVS
ncbi:hypothetical protein [Methanopyrus sp. KOL6]|uniref:hypothetical protein n=1 Tax=Methanopyrus sp. KOL6 TaxID=1937004 RepID=UPI000B4B74DA|nr:hypothetical protein [Methanopyrus sp. KOL6]